MWLQSLIIDTIKVRFREFKRKQNQKIQLKDVYKIENIPADIAKNSGDRTGKQKKF